jgi:hypothetical protein
MIYKAGYQRGTVAEQQLDGPEPRKRIRVESSALRAARSSQTLMARFVYIELEANR